MRLSTSTSILYQNKRFGRFYQVEDSIRPVSYTHLDVYKRQVEVTVDDKPVKLTPIEYKILLLLVQNPGRVFPADEIYERVWNERAINTDTVICLLYTSPPAWPRPSAGSKPSAI